MSALEHVSHPRGVAPLLRRTHSCAASTASLRLHTPSLVDRTWLLTVFTGTADSEAI